MKLARLLLIAACAAVAACAPLTPPPRGEHIVRNLTYAHRATGDLHLDLYLPAARPPFPVVLWIHGGGWKYGDKGWMLYFRDLTREGFAVASIQYRLSGTAKYPAQSEDCREAFLWLRHRGAAYGLETEHLFLGGASAGGHLAAQLAVTEGRAHIDAVSVLYPATDLLGFKNPESTGGYLPPLLGGAVSQHRALAASGSPVRFVRPDAPPFLFFHGDRDELVPLEQSLALDRRLKAAGMESRVIVVPGAGHGFSLNPAQLHTVARFFQRHEHHPQPPRTMPAKQGGNRR